MGKFYRCDCCGLEFRHEHWDGGYTDHTNTSNSHNVKVYVSRYKEGEYTQFELFKKAMGVDTGTRGGGVSSITDMYQKYDCVIKRLRQLDENDIADMLDARRDDILTYVMASAYNKAMVLLVDAEEAVSNMRRRLRENGFSYPRLRDDLLSRYNTSVASEDLFELFKEEHSE